MTLDAIRITALRLPDVVLKMFFRELTPRVAATPRLTPPHPPPGLPRNADQGDIKKAYRKLALEWHPDRVSEEQKALAAKRFQDIGEAYEILSDDEKKGKYDRGEDVLGQNPSGPQQGHHGFPHGFPGGFPGGHFHFRQG